MIVVVSARAEADLENIGDYNAKDNPTRALSFVRELCSQCIGLGDMPLAFPLLQHYEQYGVRHRVHGNYLIFYQVNADNVVVLHVLHGAMDYAAILFPT